MVDKPCSICLLAAALLVTGACSTVRQAPVAERPGAGAEAGARQVETMTAGAPAGDDVAGEWVELPPPAQAPARETAHPGTPAPAPRLSDNPAVVALLDDTDLSLSRGNAEAAVSSVERALRLEPRNPWLWHRLALLRLRQGQWRQAAALAEKSNSLSARHPQVRKANAEVIKRARQQLRGDG